MADQEVRELRAGERGCNTDTLEARRIGGSTTMTCRFGSFTNGTGSISTTVIS